MFKIKRLHSFVIKSFIGPLLVTFFICLFIFLMQSLWHWVADFIGKGLDLSVILEFFYYSALNAIPMALPLAILLASLMAFGNMGEHLELLSIKAAGVSLFRIMAPLLIFIVFISIGAFFFSNGVLPWANNKLYSLIQGVKNTKPEVEIPENRFYDAGGLILKAQSKNKLSGMLYDVLLYDHLNKKTYENVTYADSCKLTVTKDKLFMLITLYHGETLENFNYGKKVYDEVKVPFRRDKFASREFLMDLDGEFKEKDRFGNHYICMNVQELKYNSDSLNRQVDSLEITYVNRSVYSRYFDKKVDVPAFMAYSEPNQGPPLVNWEDSTKHYVRAIPICPDSIMYSLTKAKIVKAVDDNIRNIRMYKDDLRNVKGRTEAMEYMIRRYDIEWHRKYTLSFACIVFFFIGAPLGAIIRKGGLGMPVVISVILFVIYYMVNNTGYKFAREGLWTVFAGMWLSSFFLLPLGIFLTYKAANDSAVMSSDTYSKFFKKIKIAFTPSTWINVYTKTIKAIKRWDE